MRIALISFSNNYDMQEHLYSMQEYAGRNVITVGSNNVIANFIRNEHNFLFRVPKRPIIELRTLNLMELIKIRNIICSQNIDKIIFISAHSWNYILAKILPKHIKIIHIIHDVIPHSNEKITKLTELYNRMIINVVDVFLVHSKGSVETLSKRYKVNDTKIIYIPLWTKYRDFDQCSNTHTVLFFGRINPYKGVETIINLSKDNEDMLFKIVGKVSREMEHIIDQVKSIPNIELVNKYVSEEEMHEWFKSSDLVLLPYEEATQSGIVIEAYKHSRPVLAYDVGFVKEQIQPEISGYITEPGDYDDYNNLLRNYMNLQFEQKNRICYSAWKFGKDNYAVEHVYEILINEL